MKQTAVEMLKALERSPPVPTKSIAVSASFLMRSLGWTALVLNCAASIAISAGVSPRACSATSTAFFAAASTASSINAKVSSATSASFIVTTSAIEATKAFREESFISPNKLSLANWCKRDFE